MKNQTILIIGASGLVGHETAMLLLEQGYKVRGTTSKKKLLQTHDGIEWVYADLSTGEGVKEALKGIDRAFIMSPPGYADQYKMLSPLIQEAKRNSLKKVVLLTAMGANAVETGPFRKAEIELEKSGINYNIIRPNWFFQNFNTFWIKGIREQGKILLPTGKAKGSFIDARDISAVAAKLLVNDELKNKDFDITGPEAIDHDEVAREISNATGKKIIYEEIDPAIMKQGLLNAGLPADYTNFLIMILGFFKEGYSERITDGVKQILGREPTGIKKYVKDYKSFWV